MLVIIDGANLAFRAYHTFPGFVNSKGYPTGMVYGFFSIFNSYADQFGGNVVIAWEGGKNWRKEIYPEYKQHREELAPEVKQAFEDLKELCTIAGIVQVRKLGYEADDVISFITRKIDSEVRIISNDKDLIQLTNVEKRIYLLRPVKDRGLVVYTDDMCQAEFGVPKSKIVEFLAIMGDKSDNIKGLRGFGPVKTAKLINNELNPIETIKVMYPTEVERIKKNLLLIDLNNPNTWINRITEEDIIANAPDIVTLNSKFNWLEIKNFNAKDIIMSLGNGQIKVGLINRLLEYEPTGFNQYKN